MVPSALWPLRRLTDHPGARHIRATVRWLVPRKVKTITVPVDDEAYRRAYIETAERDASVSRCPRAGVTVPS
jgi:hypothetical protein